MARTARPKVLAALAATLVAGLGFTAPAAQAGTNTAPVVFHGDGLAVRLDHRPAALQRTTPSFRRFLGRELHELWSWDHDSAACREAPLVSVLEFRRTVAYFDEGVYAVKGHPACAGGGNWQFAVKRDGRWSSPRALGGQDVPSCHRLRKWDIPRMSGAKQCYAGDALVDYRP